MRSLNDTAHLERVRDQSLTVLRDVIGDSQDVVLLDAPNQRNIGDSLIWEGERAYLSRLGVRVRYVADIRGYSASEVRRFLPDGGVVPLHGGGNFGDLWPGHQQHREWIVSELRDFKIVQLSQSIYFSSPQRAAEAHDVLAQHPDFTVLLRDTLSMQRAAEQLPRLTRVFCPDMALGYEPPASATVTAQAAGRSRRALAIARADKESASGLREVSSTWLKPAELEITDWGLHARDPLAWRTAHAIARVHHKLVAVRRKLRRSTPVLPQSIVRSGLETINRKNVESALRLYAGADVIVVDRLHAHVLAALLGIPHVLPDNNYRKLGAVFDDYTGQFETATYCMTLEDARRAATAVLEAS